MEITCFELFHSVCIKDRHSEIRLNTVNKISNEIIKKIIIKILSWIYKWLIELNITKIYSLKKGNAVEVSNGREPAVCFLIYLFRMHYENSTNTID